MPLFQALVTETMAMRRWYFVRAKNREAAHIKLDDGETVEEQDIPNSAEVLCRVVDTGTIERVVQQRQTAKPSVPCDCQLSGQFCSGVPGILAQVANCHVVPSCKVQRCDACQRYASDQAAHDRLVELGMA